MPDGDYISQKFPRYWRASAEIVRGRQSVEDFTTRSSRAFAKKLRDSGGIPGLSRAVELLRLAKEGQIDIASAYEQVGSFERSQGSLDVHLAPVMRRHLSRVDSRVPSIGELAGDVLHEIVRAEFVAPMRTLKVESPFESRVARNSYLNCCVGGLRETIDAFALSLARDPSAAGLKAISAKRSNKPIGDLLNESLT